MLTNVRHTDCSVAYSPPIDGNARRQARHGLTKPPPRCALRVSGIAYQNYVDPTLQGWQHAYYGRHLARLEAARNRLAPDHYFRRLWPPGRTMDQ